MNIFSLLPHATASKNTQADYNRGMAKVYSPARKWKKRVAIQLASPIRIDDGEGIRESRCEIVNVSPGGLLLRGSDRLAPSSLIDFRILWPPGRSCIARGTVVWSRGNSTGITFDYHNEDFEQLVHVFELSEPEDIRELIGQLRAPMVQNRPRKADPLAVSSMKLAGDKSPSSSR